MDLTSDVRQNAEILFAAFCNRRAPEEFRDEVRLLFKVQGSAITLVEERPHFMKPLLWTLSPIAQFRYEAGASKWALYCRDRKQNWFKFTPVRPTHDLSTLIDVVDQDATHIFWG